MANGKRNPDSESCPFEFTEHVAQWVENLLRDEKMLARKTLIFQAAETYERILQAQQEIQMEGLTEVNRHGETRAMPAVEIERKAKAQFSAFCRQLGIDQRPEPDNEDAKPQIGSSRTR